MGPLLQMKVKAAALKVTLHAWAVHGTTLDVV